VQLEVCADEMQDGGGNATLHQGFDLGGEGLPRINLSGAGKRILQLAILVLVIVLLMASTTSIPTGNVGVLTLFGRVTGEKRCRKGYTW